MPTPDLVPHLEGSIKANKIDRSTLWLGLTETILFDETTVVERTSTPARTMRRSSAR